SSLCWSTARRVAHTFPTRRSSDLSAAYERLTEGASGAGDAVGEGAEQINAALSNVNSTVQALSDSYNEAYEAALSSIEGQYSLRSEEHTSELQSRFDLVCRLLLEK